MKKTLILLTALSLIGCGYEERKNLEIKQEINGKYLETILWSYNDDFPDIAYYNIIVIDSSTNVKSEYKKAEKVLNIYKKIQNEIHNNSN